MQPCVQWVQHRVHSPDGYEVARYEACDHMDRDHRFVRLDGSTRDRQDVVDSFQSADGPPVFLISCAAA
jgi:hypothetical protein